MNNKIEISGTFWICIWLICIWSSMVSIERILFRIADSLEKTNIQSAEKQEKENIHSMEKLK